MTTPTREQVVQEAFNKYQIEYADKNYGSTDDLDYSSFSSGYTLARADLEAIIAGQDQLIAEQNKLAKERQEWALHTADVIRGLNATIVEQAPFVEVGKAMVELTTTVRGVEEWPAIPTLWQKCLEERDAAISKVAEQAAEIERVRNSDDHNFERWQREQDRVKVLTDALETCKSSTRYNLQEEPVTTYYFDHKKVIDALATVRRK